MARPISKKLIKWHFEVDGEHVWQDIRLFISIQDLKALGAEKRFYSITKEVYYYLYTEYSLVF